jgi:hypothetical protein
MDVGNAVISKFSSWRTGELCNFVTQVMKFGRGLGWKKIPFKKFLNLDFTLYDRIVTCVMLCHYFSSEEIFNN